jgi:hypothetical protein
MIFFTKVCSVNGCSSLHMLERHSQQEVPKYVHEYRTVTCMAERDPAMHAHLS